MMEEWGIGKTIMVLKLFLLLEKFEFIREINCDFLSAYLFDNNIDYDLICPIALVQIFVFRHRCQDLRQVPGEIRSQCGGIQK